MSDATKRAMDDAISAHLREDSNSTLTGWLVVAKGKSTKNLMDGSTRYVIESNDEAEYDMVLGLAHYAVLNTEGQYSTWDED